MRSVLSLSDQQGQFLCLDNFTLIYVNLDFSLAETFYLVEHQLDSFFALKLDRSLCPVITVLQGKTAHSILGQRFYSPQNQYSRNYILSSLLKYIFDCIQVILLRFKNPDEIVISSANYPLKTLENKPFSLIRTAINTNL